MLLHFLEQRVGRDTSTEVSKRWSLCRYMHLNFCLERCFLFLLINLLSAKNWTFFIVAVWTTVVTLLLCCISCNALHNKSVSSLSWMWFLYWVRLVFYACCSDVLWAIWSTLIEPRNFCKCTDTNLAFVVLFVLWSSTIFVWIQAAYWVWFLDAKSAYYLHHVLCPSVCMFPHISMAPTGKIIWKFNIGLYHFGLPNTAQELTWSSHLGKNYRMEYKTCYSNTHINRYCKGHRNASSNVHCLHNKVTNIK